MIGIISYLPDSDLHSRRHDNCLKQLSWIRNVFPEETIHIVAQGYTDDDVSANTDNINYLRYDTGIGSHKARNLLLKQFYSSDDEWLLLMDDDVALYDYYGANEFIHDVYYSIIPVDTDIILMNDPAVTPFKKLNIQHDVMHYYNLKVSSALACPNLMLLRHPEADNEIYFDDTIDLLAADAIPDDNKFIVNCIFMGMRVNLAEFCIKQSFDRLYSVIYSTNKKENYEQHANLGKNIANYIKTVYNVPDSKTFNKTYNKAVPIKIKRTTPYSVPDNLKPEVNKNIKKLF